MCGIAGIVGHLDADRFGGPWRVVKRMTETLRHRGPDDGGLCELDVHGGLGALGYRRRAILDPPPAGHQPMTRDRCTIVYNGEIYNYRQLRSELPGSFDSNSDTEVVLALYLRHGPALIERLLGMFAFAIWDERHQRLFAARDRLGIKPFVYRPLEGGGLAFASEIKAFLGLGRPSIEGSSLRDFFTYKYILTPKTIYQGIFKLPPLTSVGRSTERRGARGVERYAMFLGPFTLRQKRALLMPELMVESGYDDLWFSRQHWRDELKPTKRIQWLDIHAHLPEDMLTKVDRATMAVSLEARPSLVDHPWSPSRWRSIRH